MSPKNGIADTTELPDVSSAQFAAEATRGAESAMVDIGRQLLEGQTLKPALLLGFLAVMRLGVILRELAQISGLLGKLVADRNRVIPSGFR